MKALNETMTDLKGKAYAVGHQISRLPTKMYVFGVYVGMATASGAASAAGGLFTGWRGAMNDIIGLLILAAMLAGIGAVLYGLTQLVKKGMGRGDDVEWREIYWPLGGGAMLTVLMYMVEGLVGESGAGVSDMGAVRTY